jgi:3-dehydroquinate dehydratase-2
MRVLIVNGPNLNLLGTRQPEIYGTTTLPEIEDLCRTWGAELGMEIDVFASNHEGAIVDRLHAAMGDMDGVVLNPGALTHYSYVLHDAIEAIVIPTVEVHLSDISAREPWRANSVVAPACVASIFGHGVAGYRKALEFLAERSAG